MSMNVGTKLVFILVGVMVACAALAPEWSEWVALGLMIAAGIPHGAFDLRVAGAKWRLEKSSRPAIFGIYTLCVFLMSGLCIYLPPLGLAIFLALSAIHFAEGEAHATSPTSHIWGCVIGISAIILPIGLHPEDARVYVRYFVPGEIFGAIELSLRYISRATALLLTLALLWSLNRERGSRRIETLERLLCVCGWIALPPLSGFSIWFLGRHSRQHIEVCAAMFPSAGRGIPLDFVLISILAIAGLVPFATRFDFSQIDQLFAASICLIAGLTLPHMIVSHRMRDLLEPNKNRGV